MLGTATVGAVGRICGLEGAVHLLAVDGIGRLFEKIVEVGSLEEVVRRGREGECVRTACVGRTGVVEAGGSPSSVAGVGSERVGGLVSVEGGGGRRGWWR